MTDHHTITAEIAYQFSISGMPSDEREVANLKVEVTFEHTVKGAGPTICHLTGGDPGWGDEFELVCAKLIDGDGLDPTDQQVHEIASDWLADKGYEQALSAVRAFA